MTGLFLHFSHHTRLCPLLGSTNGFYKAIAAAARRRVVASNRKGCKPRLVSCWTEVKKRPKTQQICRTLATEGNEDPGGGTKSGWETALPSPTYPLPDQSGVSVGGDTEGQCRWSGSPTGGQVDNRVAGPEPQRSIGIVLWKNADRYRG